MSTWQEFAEGLSGGKYAAAYSWTTSALQALLNEPVPDSLASDMETLVSEEVKSRDQAEVLKNFRFDFRFPIALVDTNTSRAKPWLSQGRLFWFAMKESKEGQVIHRVQRLFAVPHSSSFRASVEDGLSFDSARRLYIQPVDGPSFLDRILTEGSASLPVAAWSAWYLRGCWPTKPVVITGEVNRSREVRPVKGILEKHAAARDRGVAWIMTPGMPTENDPEGLVRIAIPPDASFDRWLQDCEVAMAERGVAIEPHPALWCNWDKATERLIQSRGTSEEPSEGFVEMSLDDRFPRDPEQQQRFFEKYLRGPDVAGFKLSLPLEAGKIALLAATIGGDPNLPVVLWEKLKPERVIWLCTDSRDICGIAERAKQYVTSRGCRDCRLSHGTDPDAWSEEIESHLKETGGNDNPVIIDITGGLKDNSLALWLRWRERPVHVTYVLSKHDTKFRNKPKPGTKRLIDVSFRSSTIART